MFLHDTISKARGKVSGLSRAIGLPSLYETCCETVKEKSASLALEK